MTFPKEHRTKLHSTNPLERLNGEIKRRTNVFGIFPNEAAATRLVGAIILEQNDEWAVQRARSMRLETTPAPGDDDMIRLPATVAGPNRPNPPDTTLPPQLLHRAHGQDPQDGNAAICAPTSSDGVSQLRLLPSLFSLGSLSPSAFGGPVSVHWAVEQGFSRQLDRTRKVAIDSRKQHGFDNSPPEIDLCRRFQGLTHGRWRMARRKGRKGEEYAGVNFGTIPRALRDQIENRARGLRKRDIYAEAVRTLLDELAANEDIAFIASPKDGTKLQIWIPAELADAIDDACRAGLFSSPYASGYDNA